MIQEELKEILKKHKEWLTGNGCGERAELIDATLTGADLRGIDLSGVDLRGAYLRSAYLSGSNLSESDLSGADLSGATLIDADLSGACLRGVNLSGAKLIDADLSGADLSDSQGNRREIKTIMLCDAYPITYTADRLQLGCENHAIADWWEFTDEQIFAMEGDKALNFWNEWKDTIRMLIEKSPATATVYKASNK